MSATATDPMEKYVTREEFLQPAIPPIDMDAHVADKARRADERAAKRAEMLLCLNPAHATMRELEKPVYSWTVSAQWMGKSKIDPADPSSNEVIARLEAEETVVAQNETDAWAMYCDKIGKWPSRRDANPIFKKGKRIDAAAFAASQISSGDAGQEIPTVTIGAKQKRRRA